MLSVQYGFLFAKQSLRRHAALVIAPDQLIRFNDRGSDLPLNLIDHGRVPASYVNYPFY
jgi:hypothetical protein